MIGQASRTAIPVETVEASAYTIPTDFPEADGTIAWDRTTLVLAEVRAGGKQGLGYTYADASAAALIQGTLAEVVCGQDAMNISAAWRAMLHAVRNMGRPGIASMAIAAVDSALWDLKGQLLELPLCTLLGAAHLAVPVYGSGGFTSYSLEQLSDQLGGWVDQGIPQVKMKVGTDPAADLGRVRAARAAIGTKATLFVDANGAYARKQALAFAERFRAEGVSWFEEPVSADDLAGLHLLRDRAPAGMEIAAGEYGFDLSYFRHMLEAGAVDVLQADATRCSGITGFLQTDALCQAYGLELSAHCAPSLHIHPCCAVVALRHLEYFHDHVRIEHMLFDGARTPIDGALHPDLVRPGLGLEFKHSDAESYRVGTR